METLEDSSIEENTVEHTLYDADKNMHAIDQSLGNQESTQRPDWLPTKFWDDDQSAPRIEALARSYVELERKLGTSIPRPADEKDCDAYSKLYQILGRPDSPQDYDIDVSNDDIQIDSSINQRLFDAGLTTAQAQLVYDLAAEYLESATASKLSDLDAKNDLRDLSREFGGDEHWNNVAAQLDRWGQSSLPSDVYQALASSVDGVRAMYAMMQRTEPDLIDTEADATLGVDETVLADMVRDPRYWKKRDPEFVAKVTERFREFYSSQE